MAGLAKVGDNGVLDFKLLSADPAPPARDNNTGSLSVTPYMPEHKHGTPIEVEITAGAPTSGQYTLSPLNLWMPGIWQTTIVATAGSVTDRVAYTFCIAE